MNIYFISVSKVFKIGISRPKSFMLLKILTLLQRESTITTFIDSLKECHFSGWHLIDFLLLFLWHFARKEDIISDLKFLKNIFDAIDKCLFLHVFSYLPFFFCRWAVYGLWLLFSRNFYLFHLSEIFVIVNISINTENRSMIFNTNHFIYGGFWYLLKITKVYVNDFFFVIVMFGWMLNVREILSGSPNHSYCVVCGVFTTGFYIISGTWYLST